jgi:transposase-like protein
MAVPYNSMAFQASHHDEEFRSQAVRLVLDDGKTIGAVARDLDLTPSALRL